jgi:hypothetical protein
MRAAQPTLAALLFSLCWACVQQHEGPQSSDTVTNWLRRCERQQDCTGLASCLHALCTVACDESRVDVCAEGHASLLCDTQQGTCDLPCQSARACHVLGAGYTCEAGHCRALVDVMSVVGESSGGPPSSDAEPIVEGVGSALTMREHATLPTPRGTAFELSQTDYDNGNPDVTWTGTLFRVTWGESGIGNDAHLGGADISPSANYTLRSFDLGELLAKTRVQGAKSILALGTDVTEIDGYTCWLQSLDLDAGRIGSLLRFPCDGRLRAAPVGVADEWIVAWRRRSPQPGMDTEQIAVMRYRTNAESWLDGPRTFAIPVSMGSVDSLAVVGSDVWFGHDQDNVHKISGFVPPTRPDVPVLEPFSAAEITAFSLGDKTLYGTLWPLADGVLVLRPQGEGVRLDTIRSDGTQPAPTHIDAVNPSNPKTVSMPERRASAVCLDGPSYLSIWIVNEDGAISAGPIVVDEDPTAADCDLAWSGEELLVAWRHGPVSGSGSVRAKIISLP